MVNKETFLWPQYLQTGLQGADQQDGLVRQSEAADSRLQLQLCNVNTRCNICRDHKVAANGDLKLFTVPFVIWKRVFRSCPHHPISLQETATR